MNIIEKKAQDMAEIRIGKNRIGNPRKLIDEIHNDLYDVDNETDKLKYLTIVLEANDFAYQEHLKDCTNKESCGINREHEEVNYFLQQELNRIGVKINDDSFSREEKEIFTEYLNKILSELKELKDGQQIIYDDLNEEIEELKKWFLLGKKNWRQLVVGKFGEMVASGIVSAGISETILNEIKKDLPMLIG